VLRREQIIGIVSSWDIRWRESTGYSLLVTDSRVFGASRPGYSDNFWAYLGPGTYIAPETRSIAYSKAAEIIAKKDFELQRDKIVKIIYDAPGNMVGGRLIIAEVGRKIELSITVVSGWNPGISSTLNTLLDSLRIFAPDRVYSEKTGQRVLGPHLNDGK
jgi:hypothetical protein